MGRRRAVRSAPAHRARRQAHTSTAPAMSVWGGDREGDGASHRLADQHRAVSRLGDRGGVVDVGLHRDSTQPADGSAVVMAPIVEGHAGQAPLGPAALSLFELPCAAHRPMEAHRRQRRRVRWWCGEPSEPARPVFLIDDVNHRRSLPNRLSAGQGRDRFVHSLSRRWERLEEVGGPVGSRLEAALAVGAHLVECVGARRAPGALEAADPCFAAVRWQVAITVLAPRSKFKHQRPLDRFVPSHSRSNGPPGCVHDCRSQSEPRRRPVRPSAPHRPCSPTNDPQSRSWPSGHA